MHGVDFGYATTLDSGRWCQHCGIPANRLIEVEYVPRSELTGAVALLREARAMIPHADVPSTMRNDWCARADKALGRGRPRGQ